MPVISRELTTEEVANLSESRGPDHASGSNERSRSASQWILRRNCSLSPRELLAIFGSLACLSLGMATYWASQGAWMVTPFAVAECLALGVAFLVYARHACDCERVILTASEVRVELSQGRRLQQVVLPREWLRIEGADTTDLITLRSGRSAVSLGRFIDQDERRGFVEAFRRALQTSAD